MLKLFLVLVIFGVAFVVVEGRHHGYKRGRGLGRRKHGRFDAICGAITEQCSNLNTNRTRWVGSHQIGRNPTKSHHWRRRRNTTICGVKGDVYENYTKCSFLKAKICDNVEKVHYGNCGDCDEKNVCTMKGKFKERKVCTLSGDEYTACEFEKLKCQAAKDGEFLPVKKIACVCDEENVCPWFQRMKGKHQALKVKRERRHHKLIKAVDMREILFARKQCNCKNKVAACKAEQDGSPPPKQIDCR